MRLVGLDACLERQFFEPARAEGAGFPAARRSCDWRPAAQLVEREAREPPSPSCGDRRRARLRSTDQVHVSQRSGLPWRSARFTLSAAVR